jgi:hypothetical protein
MAAICYTDKKLSLFFSSCFHEEHQMIDAFNNYYAAKFTQSWLNCIEESMGLQGNKFTPGFMCVPQKPNPKENEYHSIADANRDGIKPIIWQMKLIEGKDKPKADGQYVYALKIWEEGTLTNSCTPH